MSFILGIKMRCYIALIFLALVFYPSTSHACENNLDSASSLTKRFPIIVSGKFTNQENFQIEKIYKGFRKRQIYLDITKVHVSKEQLNERALFYADYAQNSSIAGGCEKIVFSKDNFNGVSYASLLAEAAVYDVTAIIKTKDIPLDGEAWRKYEDVSAFLRENGDSLLLLESAYSTLLNITQNLTGESRYGGNDFARYSGQAKGEYQWNQCISTLRTSEDYISDDLKSSLAKAVRQNFKTYIFRDAIRDFSTSLSKIREFDSALYALCASDSWEVFIASAMSAKRPDLLNGKKFEQVYGLADVDISGVTLRKIRASGTWKNVALKDTDLTNSRFEGGDFSGIKLEDAKLDLVSYTCKTKFPEGFDPVAHHMVPQWRHQGCENAPLPKVDLRNVIIKPFFDHKATPRNSIGYDYEGNNKSEYDEIDLWHIDFDGINAENAQLGRISCSSCEIKNGNFNGVTLHAPTGLAMHISDSTFRNADLSNSDINRTTLTNVDFSGANLSGVDLHDTTLIGVNFSGANITGAKFGGAKYDMNTKFPVDFDPQQAGMTQIESK